MFKEQRLDPRERLALPLEMRDGTTAMTRDISASGLYFEMPGDHEVQGLVDFEMQLPELRMKFTAVGEIVRVDHRSGTTGVAVKLLSPKLDTLE